MNPPWETDTTTKVSEAQRILFYNDVERRLEKLLKLLDRVLQYSPSPTELEAFEDDSDYVLFPLMGEDHPAGNWIEEGEVDRHENTGEDDGAEGGGGMHIQDCPERDAIAAAIYQRLDMPADDMTKYSLPWKDTFPGKLEMFLDHLDEHGCHRIVALAQIAASEGQARQAEDPDRRRAFINLEFVSFLELEITKANEVISKPHIRSNISSGHRTRLNAFRMRTAFRGGRGLGSPLVEGFTPDQMPVDEPRHIRVFDPFQLWAPLLVWGPQSLPARSVRTGPSILVEVETSTETSAAEGSEDPGEQDEIL
ncbi:hypothetical protein E4U35_004404 [Claviceps purpurea]|nr:hypothetical protein E4U12_008234 [Claviceps purpurea]KAG6177992.1 hypothetical protein E4U27_004025 [Claviceps purpurea]KAG6178688.1 hypothetical protein E4U10_008108 [Claviceps purpurea]KAG6210765.1 hypothetical protein E4U35_004404 [Claviceps purpurea]KAG6227785.1 hypothetical protein E4U34_005236 [Claviceps purpurea]